ncbi:MAG: hypothetical protein JO271_05180, partial [Verrucomicrobia bacterium]|nr:hypothetical protein [Verrucomicrobiota bacterium]
MPLVSFRSVSVLLAVLSDGHQTLIPPELAFFQSRLGQMLPALLFNLIEHSTIPDRRVASGLNEAM